MAWRRRASGGGQDELLLSPKNDRGLPVSLTWPAWSPDGSQIAFLAGQGNISVVNADGADRHILTPLRGKIGEAGVLCRGDASFQMR
jgi:Tol biopolymer transport system component